MFSVALIVQVRFVRSAHLNGCRHRRCPCDQQYGAVVVLISMKRLVNLLVFSSRWAIVEVIWLFAFMEINSLARP